MRLLLLVLVLFAFPASAQVNCYRLGQYVNCSTGQQFQQRGNIVFDNRGKSWIGQGDYLHGSDGSTYTEHGGAIYDNRGNFWQRAGNSLIGRNVTCQWINDRIYCN